MKQRSRSTRASVGRRSAFALVFALAGCASAKTATYTLSAVAPADATARRSLRVPIEVGQVSIPPAIDRNEIVLRAPDDRLAVAGSNVWGAPVRELIRAALSEDLMERLAPGSVLPPGAPVPGKGLQILTLIIREFSGDIDGRVILDANWGVAPSGRKPRGALREERISLYAGTGTVAVIVPAMSRALGLLADRIAAALS